MIITIDGPTASGKSTVGRLLAQELNYYYLYTGLLYRALAYVLMKKHGYTLETISNPDMKQVDELLESKKMVYQYDASNRERILWNGENITPFLTSDTVGQAASIVSTHCIVRERLNRLQQEIANDHDLVIDGRDSGSVVFAHADHKFFLTASEDERAARWQRQQESRGAQLSFEDAYSFINQRDTRDSSRKNAPLIIPTGARVIDTTHMTATQALIEIKRSLD